MHTINRLLLIVVYLLLTLAFSQVELTSEQLLLDYVKAADYENVEHLLLDGVDINFTEKIEGYLTALHLAAVSGYDEIVKLLLRHGADVHAQEGVSRATALHLAAMEGFETIVKDLVTHGSHLETKEAQYNETALHLAALHGQETIVQVLLEHNAYIETKNSLGYTPLLSATIHNHIETVQVLLQYGAHVNILDPNGKTPLFYAVMYGYEPIVKSLIQAKAIFPKDLLHTAVVAERLSIVRLLIQMGVDLEARDQTYCTAIHYAISGALGGSNDAIMKELLAAGVNIHAMDQNGKTALDLSRELGMTKVMRMLLQHEQQQLFSMSSITSSVRSSYQTTDLAELQACITSLWSRLSSPIRSSLIIYLMMLTEDAFLQAKQSKQSKLIRPALAEKVAIEQTYRDKLQQVSYESIEERCSKETKKQRQAEWQSCIRSLVVTQRREVVEVVESEKEVVANRIHSLQDVELLEELERVLTLL